MMSSAPPPLHTPGPCRDSLLSSSVEEAEQAQQPPQQQVAALPGPTAHWRSAAECLFSEVVMTLCNALPRERGVGLGGGVKGCGFLQRRMETNGVRYPDTEPCLYNLHRSPCVY